MLQTHEVFFTQTNKVVEAWAGVVWGHIAVCQRAVRQQALSAAQLEYWKGLKYGCLSTSKQGLRAKCCWNLLFLLCIALLSAAAAVMGADGEC